MAQTLINYLKKQGYDMTVRTAWDNHVRVWWSWYKGKVAKFHAYKIWNGQKELTRERLSLQMAKQCCEDWADLLFNERVEISVDSGEGTVQLNEVLAANDFWELANDGIEQTGGTGTGAFVVRVDGITYPVIAENPDGSVVVDMLFPGLDNAKTVVEYVPYDNIYPLSWNGRKVTECAFSVQKTEGGKSYVVLVSHLLNEAGNYVIRSQTFTLDKSGNVSPFGEETEFDTRNSLPWFSICRYAVANNIDGKGHLPWGLPPFANAIDTLKAMDVAFDGLSAEIELGRRMKFIKEELLHYDGEGTTKTFSPDDPGMFVIPKNKTADSMYHDAADDLRTPAITEALEADLSRFSKQVGFGSDFYHFRQKGTGSGNETATAVVSRNSTMFRRKKKHETPLEGMLVDLLKAISWAASEFGPYSIDTTGMRVTFDDSIIEDKETEATNKRKDVAAGLALPEEYRIDILGESAEQAAKIISVIQNRKTPTLDELLTEAQPDPARLEALGVPLTAQQRSELNAREAQQNQQQAQREEALAAAGNATSTA